MEAEKILVVDDNKEIVYSISELLKYEGYETLKAYDGMEALDIMERENVDLILLDVMMPRLNGLSALMKLREKSRIPVIILSAKTEESDKVSGLTLGADDYIEKPYKKEAGTDQKIVLEITNTSGYEMDFEKEDIIERFSRGDKARTSEGNGLGLAIVSTYAKALGGEFDIKIDCDQFKAIVSI